MNEFEEALRYKKKSSDLFKEAKETDNRNVSLAFLRESVKAMSIAIEKIEKEHRDPEKEKIYQELKKEITQVQEILKNY